MRSRRIRFTKFAWVSSIFLASTGAKGCSDSRPPEASAPDAGTEDGSDSKPAICEQPDGGATTETFPILFQKLTATIFDTLEIPVEGVPVAVCGKIGCTADVQTGSDGAVTMTVPPVHLARPTARWGDGLSWALFGTPLDTAVATVTGRTAALTKTNSVITSDAAVEAVVGDGGLGSVILTIPGNLTPYFDPFLFDTEAKKMLRVAIITSTVESELLAPGQGFDVIVPLGPAPVMLCGHGPGARLAITKSGFSAGTELEFYQFEFHGTERLGRFGEWSRISEGMVSQDGTAATSNDGGLHVITAVGIKKKTKQ
jgi:hypothetical protein